jgi:hypothetical protein
VLGSAHPAVQDHQPGPNPDLPVANAGAIFGNNLPVSELHWGRGIGFFNKRKIT